MENLVLKLEENWIRAKILVVRGQQVMLDRDIADLYGVETRRLNEQAKRNIERFPEEFMFQMSDEEFENWRSQIKISNSDDGYKSLMSQNATSNRGGIRKHPYVFTEHGVTMLASDGLKRFLR